MLEEQRGRGYPRVTRQETERETDKQLWMKGENEREGRQRGETLLKNPTTRKLLCGITTRLHKPTNAPLYNINMKSLE